MASPGPSGDPREAYRRLARAADLEFVDLDAIEPEPAAVELLSAWSARALAAVPVSVRGGVAVVAVATPDEEKRVTLGGLAGRRIRLAIAEPGAIARALGRLYPAPAVVAPAPRDARPVARVDARTLARHAGLAFTELRPEEIDDTVATTFSEPLARRFRALPFARRGGVLRVAIADPFDAVAIRVVRILAGEPVELAIAERDAIADALDRVYGAPDRAEPVEQLVGPGPRPLGELLVATGLVDRDAMQGALREQERTGDRIGEILVHTGLLDEDQLAGALAAQLRVPVLDVSRYRPDPVAIELIPERVARQRRVVPLTVSNHVLYVATRSDLDDATLAEIREHTQMPIRIVVASARSIERLLQRVYSEDYVEIATVELLNRSPEESAFRVLSLPQKILLVAVAVVGVLALAKDPIRAIIAFNIASVAFYSAFSLYKFKLIYNALGHSLELPVTDDDLAALDDATLPTHTILVPLYREADVVPRLLGSLSRLDYPTTKLDVKLIVEEDDEETIAALREDELPPHFRLVVVPDTQPKTKPKACNYGLIQAEGDYVVIYDAEDRPEPDQLKRVVAAYRKAEDRIVCIQCKLNYFNRSQNILTRWFTTEYSNWFDLLMPGLDASDAPIPLGGTSNHFVRSKLIELGAWDPFNVTEDADLGIRLHKAGYKTAIIDSTTYEEANSDLYNWIRQRSRWVKGYIQTWLVHMRHPFRLYRQLGWRSFFSFQMIIAGTFVAFLLNPFYWVLTTLWLLSSADAIRELFPGFVYYAAAAALFLGNFTFTYVNVAGAMRRGYFDLVKYALLSPLYWALMSFGAYKGLVQLVYRPFYWEKTVHGLDLPVPETE